MPITTGFLYFLQVVNLIGFQNILIQIGCDIIYYIRGLRMNLVRDKNDNRDMKIHSYFVLFVFHVKLSIFIMRHEVFSIFIKKIYFHITMKNKIICYTSDSTQYRFHFSFDLIDLLYFHATELYGRMIR